MSPERAHRLECRESFVPQFTSARSLKKRLPFSASGLQVEPGYPLNSFPGAPETPIALPISSPETRGSPDPEVFFDSGNSPGGFAGTASPARNITFCPLLSLAACIRLTPRKYDNVAHHGPVAVRKSSRGNAQSKNTRTCFSFQLGESDQ